jgi:gas vesicle protein
MKASEILAFVAGAAAATGITLLCTTEKGKEIREKLGEKMSREEIDRLIAKLKEKRDSITSDDDFDIDIEDDDFGTESHDEL